MKPKDTGAQLEAKRTDDLQSGSAKIDTELEQEATEAEMLANLAKSQEAMQRARSSGVTDMMNRIISRQESEKETMPTLAEALSDINLADISPEQLNEFIKVVQGLQPKQ